MTGRALFTVLAVAVPFSLSAQADPNALARSTSTAGSVVATIQAPLAELRAWKIVSEPQSREIVVQVTTNVFSTAPYFDSVRLQRESGTTRTVCGTFGRPELGDDGTNRFWTYRMSRPTAGGCGGLSSGSFVAVGVKGVTEYRTAPAP